MAVFKGFHAETLTFFKDLARNNSREWFEAHRDQYDRHVKKPSCDFVVAMGEKLREFAPDVNAIPKVNQSLFRLNRDTRFSHDKRPYKTNLGILFWEGMRKRMECSGFYFHVEENMLMLGAGLYLFPKPMLEPYRQAVVDKKHGKSLQQAISQLVQKGISIQGRHYQRLPAGYDPGHENAELLLHNGLYAGLELPVPDAFFSGELIDFALVHYRDMLPLHQWLRNSL